MEVSEILFIAVISGVALTVIDSYLYVTSAAPRIPPHRGWYLWGGGIIARLKYGRRR